LGIKLFGEELGINVGMLTYYIQINLIASVESFIIFIVDAKLPSSTLTYYGLKIIKN